MRFPKSVIGLEIRGEFKKFKTPIAADVHAARDKREINSLDADSNTPSRRRRRTRTSTSS
jgi:hypothetical protein